MDRPVSIRVDVIQSHIDDSSDAVPVDVVHREGQDLVVTQNLLFAGIDIPEADVHDRLSVEAGLQPLVEGSNVCSSETKARCQDGRKLDELRGPSVSSVNECLHPQEGDRAAVQVTRVSRLGSVNIGMGIDLKTASEITGKITLALNKEAALEKRRIRHTQMTHAFGCFFIVPEMVPIA